MRVRDWQDILNDVAEADAEPDEWRAVGGDRRDGVGEDLFIGHPTVGVFQLKTYAKNPRDVRGVGTRVARKVDDGLADYLPTEESESRFAVNTPPEDEAAAEETAERLETVIETHADAPTTPDALFEDIMNAVDSPAFGPMEFDHRDRPEPLEELTDTFEEADELLDAELDDLVETDDVGRGFQ
ncbi:MAG: hypothetical protein ABEJ08_04545 [Halobacteriaceae archaeon]